MKLQLKPICDPDSPLVRMLKTDGRSTISPTICESPWVLINRLTERLPELGWPLPVLMTKPVISTQTAPKPHSAITGRTARTGTHQRQCRHPNSSEQELDEDEDDLPVQTGQGRSNLNYIANTSAGTTHRLKKLNPSPTTPKSCTPHEGWTIDELAGLGDDRCAYERFIRSGITPTKPSRRCCHLTTPSIASVRAAETEPLPGATSESIPSNELCRHDLVATQCSTCKYDGEPPAYIVDGGAAFHSRPDCPALESGQRVVELRGGIPSEVRQVSRGSNELADRQPCIVCFPNGNKT